MGEKRSGGDVGRVMEWWDGLNIPQALFTEGRMSRPVSGSVDLPRVLD